MIKRVILIVMDSVGVGELPDAARFNDGRAQTLLHVYEHRGTMEIPNLCALGMGKIVDVGCETPEIIGCYGKMAERSANKDTTSGHWELAGLVLDPSLTSRLAALFGLAALRPPGPSLPRAAMGPYPPAARRPPLQPPPRGSR